MVTSLKAIAAALLLPVAVRCITPEQMLSAPRYSPAKPNANGEWAVYTSTSYSWDKAKAKTTWKLINIGSGNITDLPYDSEVSEMVWIGDTPTSVLYLNGSNSEVPGGVTLWTADLAQPAVAAKQVASLPAPYSGLKAATTSGGSINFVLNAEAYAKNGSAYNEELATKPRTTGMLYDSNYVRHWDAIITQQRHAVFSGTLAKGYGGWSFNGEMKNLLKGVEAPITRPESPVGPYFDDGDYQLSPDGSQVVFLTKAPELPKANYTASYLYIVPHDGSSVAKKLNGPGTKAPEAAKGASGAAKWSPDGKKIAYFQLDGISYESDRAKLYIADVSTGDISQTAADWDHSATSIEWDPKGNDLWVSAEYIGGVRLFAIPTDAPADYQPKNLTGITQVTGAYVLPDSTALVSGSAVWSSYLLYTVAADGQHKWLYKANEHDPELAGLGPEDVDYFWYDGILGDKQQSIIVKPDGFDANKVYDLVFYVHGGPAGYTGNSWSTRWNLKTWADQGYVLIGPNPTGSTSYGQGLCDRIRGEWGGLPYDDLVNAHKTACETLPYINCSNAVGAGASYGGYMMNWIQGHDLGRQLKAIVSHDGIATNYADYATDELWFIHTSHNGTIWQPGSTYGKWDPMSHAANFSTPEFVIHSEHDYRLPVSEGLAQFNVLQQQGVPSRFLNFPDETHWVLKRENSLYWHHSIYDWINYWTGKVATLNTTGVITQ